MAPKPDRPEILDQNATAPTGGELEVISSQNVVAQAGKLVLEAAGNSHHKDAVELLLSATDLEIHGGNIDRAFDTLAVARERAGLIGTEIRMNVHPESIEGLRRWDVRKRGELATEIAKRHLDLGNIQEALRDLSVITPLPSEERHKATIEVLGLIVDDPNIPVETKTTLVSHWLTPMDGEYIDLHMRLLRQSTLRQPEMADEPDALDDGSNLPILVPQRSSQIEALIEFVSDKNKQVEYFAELAKLSFSQADRQNGMRLLQRAIQSQHAATQHRAAGYMELAMHTGTEEQQSDGVVVFLAKGLVDMERFDDAVYVVSKSGLGATYERMEGGTDDPLQRVVDILQEVGQTSEALRMARESLEVSFVSDEDKISRRLNSVVSSLLAKSEDKQEVLMLADVLQDTVNHMRVSEQERTGLILKNYQRVIYQLINVGASGDALSMVEQVPSVNLRLSGHTAGLADKHTLFKSAVGGLLREKNFARVDMLLKETKKEVGKQFTVLRKYAEAMHREGDDDRASQLFREAIHCVSKGIVTSEIYKIAEMMVDMGLTDTARQAVEEEVEAGNISEQDNRFIGLVLEGKKLG